MTADWPLGRVAFQVAWQRKLTPDSATWDQLDAAERKGWAAVAAAVLEERRPPAGLEPLAVDMAEALAWLIDVAAGTRPNDLDPDTAAVMTRGLQQRVHALGRPFLGTEPGGMLP